MTRVIREEKYPDGSLKSRETKLYNWPEQQVILKEVWYLSRVDPWQATNSSQRRGGQQKYKQNFVNGQRHGLQEGWYRNGQQEYKWNYVNGQLHGIQEYWYPSGVDPSDPWQATNAAQQRGGQQQYKYNYVNGQLHGLQESWYPSGVDPSDPSAQRRGGQQECKLTYVNGQFHGVQERWYPSGVDPLNPWQATDAAQQRSGQQQYKLNFVNGQEHGLQEGWYDNGRQEYKMNYVNGKRYGLREYWYPSGVDPPDPTAKCSGQRWSKKYYFDGIEVSQESYQSYAQRLTLGIQEVLDLEEPNLSRVIVLYLLP
jgi:antitoxin component YwqK of YwqJK toxin-antitoxin module